MKADELIAQAQDLKAPSPPVIRLLAMLSEEEADNEEIIQVITRDSIISSKLLGLCNAAVYGLVTPVTSIDQAVLYLGHSEIHRLVMTASFGSALSPALKGYAIGEQQLWQHSLLTAHVAVLISERTPHPVIDPAIAYTGGLIHDIGKNVISRALTPEGQTAVLGLIEQKEHTLLQAERTVLGTDHAEVGARLLRKWRLPELLVEGVANHHKPAYKPHAKLSALVHVADLIAHEAGNSPGIGSYAMQADEAAVAALGFGPTELEGLVIEAYDTLADVEGMRAVC
jgi:putative nucleotidyltransferase with HDIG domain